MEHVIFNWRIAASITLSVKWRTFAIWRKDLNLNFCNLKVRSVPQVVYSPSAMSPRTRKNENRNARFCFPTMHSSPPPRGFKHRTTDLRVGLVFRDSIVKKYYRKYCLVRTRTPQAEGESRGRSRARGITWKLRKTATAFNCFNNLILKNPVKNVF